MAGNPAGKCRDFDHSPEKLRATLNNIFRLQDFRVNQLEAIKATILKKNVLVVGDNGAGKSLCYQLPACLSAGVTVVISPLISLIQDQMQKLTELGIVARTLSGDIGPSDADSIYQQLSEKDPIIKLLYVTPEKRRMNRQLIEALQDLFANGLLARFVIDEAHCISQCDFRPAYGILNELQQDFPGVPMIALSAPIGPLIQEDILNQLQMTNPQVFTMTLNRTNLKYAVPTRTTRFGEMDCITWIKEHYPHDSGIVYCWRRDDCDNMADSLKEAGLLACSYHAGMPYRDREIAQNKWNGNECQVICATSAAFGMGIHKPDVRYVIHTFLPKSMEHYHRETGRAGRDGNMSHCILFYSDSDHGVLGRAIRNDESVVEKSKDGELVDLEPMVEYCWNMKDCRRIQLLTYFAGVDTEANLCEENAEAICDNCESANLAWLGSGWTGTLLTDRPAPAGRPLLPGTPAWSAPVWARTTPGSWLCGALGPAAALRTAPVLAWGNEIGS
ncbi:Bloom syndrome protein homolog isoform X2 [Gadus morhua]|nr:Bloom syndrome protein homolog isoform X2 [Gadus morhua]XP_030197535.1 Bloom syndrome protein homolog isoform X2 [Gadus morhua]XP_030197536.1 Bloom syndrome protein homolog isoform X2 [Gadus morhua]